MAQILNPIMNISIHSKQWPFIFALLTGFAIPISSAATNIFIVLTFISFMLNQGFNRQNLSKIAHHPLAMSALLLFSLMIIGTSYSPVENLVAWSQVKKYLELLYLPLFILVFSSKKRQVYGLWAFLAAMLLTLLFSYLTAWGLFHYKGTMDNPFVFKQHIAQNILMAFSVYLLWFLAKKHRFWRYLGFLLATLAAVNVFMVQGRSGYVILLALILLITYQLWTWRGLLLGLLLIAGLSVAVYHRPLHERAQETVQQMADYQHGIVKNSLTIRLQFQYYSAQLFWQHPWFGTGTGSFAQQYGQLAAEKDLFPSSNPHNEYLLIANQLGGLGLLALIGFFYQMGRLRTLTGDYAPLASALTVTLVVGCAFNSMLLDFTEGHAFIYLLAVVYARLTGETALTGQA